MVAQRFLGLRRRAVEQVQAGQGGHGFRISGILGERCLDGLLTPVTIVLVDQRAGEPKAHHQSHVAVVGRIHGLSQLADRLFFSSAATQKRRESPTSLGIAVFGNELAEGRLGGFGLAEPCLGLSQEGERLAMVWLDLECSLEIDAARGEIARQRTEPAAQQDRAHVTTVLAQDLVDPLARGLTPPGEKLSFGQSHAPIDPLGRQPHGFAVLPESVAVFAERPVGFCKLMMRFSVFGSGIEQVQELDLGFAPLLCLDELRGARVTLLDGLLGGAASERD